MFYIIDWVAAFTNITFNYLVFEKTRIKGSMSGTNAVNRYNAFSWQILIKEPRFSSENKKVLKVKDSFFFA